MKTFKRGKAIGFFDEGLNLVIHEGKVIDASFVETPRQRNAREENKQQSEIKSTGSGGTYFWVCRK